MILSICIVFGFQKEIREKVVGFGAHIQVTSFNYENSNVFKPIAKNQSFYPNITQEKGIESIQVFAIKEGILKTKDEIYGLLVKGIDNDFNWDFFNKHLVEGKAISIEKGKKSSGILISSYVSKVMQINLGDAIIIYFFKDDKSRPRKFVVEGIYDTGLEKFDKNMAICDIKHIQQLQGWNEDEVGGFEILLSDFKYLEKMDAYIYDYIGFELNTEKITTQNQDIFGWLELQDINVIIIVLLMVLVCCVNMASALLVWILEKTNFIGIMKALGSNNQSLRKIFLWNATYLMGIGLFYGNVLGIGLALIQKKFKIMKLDKESYYLDAVPIDIDVITLLELNALTLFVCLATMLIPLRIISKINPTQAIKFN